MNRNTTEYIDMYVYIYREREEKEIKICYMDIK